MAGTMSASIAKASTIQYLEAFLKALSKKAAAIDLRRRWLVRLVVGLAFCAIGIAILHLIGSPRASPTAPGSDIRTFRIAAGPLDAAIVRFSEQVDIQVVFDPKVALGETSNGVTGNVTIAQALSRLLACTGLRGRFLNAHTITIEPANAAAEDRADVRGCRARRAR
jgi:hypothetical protein